MATIDYTKISLTSFKPEDEVKKIPWETEINRQFGGLFGYAEDLKK